MSKHVIIEIDPVAQYEWNRCAIRGLFSSTDVDLKQLVQGELSQPGHYLAKITLAVEVVEFMPLQEPETEAIQEQKDSPAPPFEFAA